MTVNELIAQLSALPEGLRNEHVWIEIETNILAVITVAEYNPKFAVACLQYEGETRA